MDKENGLIDMGRTKEPVTHWINKNTRQYPRPTCNTINPNIQYTENEEEVTCALCKRSIEKLKKLGLI